MTEKETRRIIRQEIKRHEDIKRKERDAKILPLSMKGAIPPRGWTYVDPAKS